MVREFGKCGMEDIPSAIMYNVATDHVQLICPDGFVLLATLSVSFWRIC